MGKRMDSIQYRTIKENIMPKKPVKIILKFSNNSTPYDNHSSDKGKGKGKPPKKSGKKR